MPSLNNKLETYKVQDCKITFSWHPPPVNPKPEPMCGTWSMQHSYTSTVPSFQAIAYYNGSIGYHLNEEVFEVRNYFVKFYFRIFLTKS